MFRKCLSAEGWRVLHVLHSLVEREQAILAGGTALAIRIGHRISYNLDFFTAKEFSVDSAISEIRNSRLPFRMMSEGAGTLNCEVNGVKFSLLRYEYPFLESPLVLDGIPLAGILDIAAMKMIAVSQRGLKRDFVDLYFILQDVPFHRIARQMVQRFGPERVAPLHIGKSLVFFSDADSNPEPAYCQGKAVDWEEVKKFLRQHVKKFVLDLDAAVKNRR